MMKQLYSFFVLVLLALQLPAQTRYVDIVTDSVKVETLLYAEKDSQKLELDVYLPALDRETRRPVFLYVHGGGFSGGTRNDKGIVTFMTKLAQRGYVAVSISYRLTRKDTPEGFGCDCPANAKLTTFALAAEDMNDAAAFLAENQDKLGIDPFKIIVAGSSAGAETVLNAVYPGPHIRSEASAGFAYAGVISMAGAIPDTASVTKQNAVPSLFFHGTCDNLVPYGKASHRYCQPGQPGYLILCGGQVIAEKLRRLGKPYWLHTTCGGDHSLAGSPMSLYFKEITGFCHDFVILGKRDQIHTILPGEHACDYPEFDYCD